MTLPGRFITRICAIDERRTSATTSGALFSRRQLVAGAAALNVAIAASQAFAAAMARYGVRVYQKWCAPCHDPGVEHPGTLALTAKYQGVKTGVLLERTDLAAAVTTAFVRTGISVMPFFRKTEISDAELAALAAYLARNTP